jgi:TIR domain
LNIDFAALKLERNEVMGNDAPNIFISYRRADAPGHAGRIFDSLSRAFGTKQIFMDVTAIQPGESFGRRIERTLDASGAVVVIVGREWLNLLKSREREVSERDLVRAEMAAALKRDILIIPVLVEGAQMPTAAELPPDVQPLAERNALEVSDARWDYDMTRLVDALTQAPGIEKLGDRKLKSAWARPLVVLLGQCVLGAIAIAGWKFLHQTLPRPIFQGRSYKTRWSMIRMSSFQTLSAPSWLPKLCVCQVRRSVEFWAAFFLPKRLWVTQLSRPVAGSFASQKATRLMSISSTLSPARPQRLVTCCCSPMEST